MKNLIFLSLFGLFVSCEDEATFKTGKVFIGNHKVDAETLSLGKQVYLEYCMACHGRAGDGNGPAAKGSFPPPRNFKQGLYKFGYAADSGLPSDEDFHRIIKHGLNGTAMLKWDMSDRQIYAVTQYLKTFAPQVWENSENEPGVKVQLSKDPYTIARRAAAVERGKKAYHGIANCQSCHRAYVSRQELSNINQEINGEPITDFEDELYELKLQESEYYFYDSEERYAKYLPPDFTWHPLRSINSVEDIAWRLAAGVTGAGMPAWKGVLEDADIWATAYYVADLMKLRDNHKAREEFMLKLAKDNLYAETKNKAKKETKNLRGNSKNEKEVASK